MATDLIELKNLGKTSVQWLNAVGIRTLEQLNDIGSVAAYCKVRNRGFKVSKVLLYALEGALSGAHWNDLNAEQKARLLKAVDEHSPNGPTAPVAPTTEPKNLRMLGIADRSVAQTTANPWSAHQIP